MNNSYKICNKCIMDTSDSSIKFDTFGICEYCNNFDLNIKPHWQNQQLNKKKFLKLSNLILESGKNKNFDCVIGLSGGLDSSYTAYVAKEKMGLRPLLFHVDAGWNTDQAVGNIEKLVNGLGLDLYTEVANWDSVKRMQVAFLKSAIPDQDLVQDAVFFSQLYKFAKKYKIKYVLTGSNFSTECCREPEEWGGYLGVDKKLFTDVWQRHGDQKPIDFPLIDILTSKIWFQIILGMQMVYPLNLVNYTKKDAENELKDKFNWQSFKHKHHESRFTRFYEDYWLPKRFGYDKRKAHFSSLIMTKQMSRNDALQRIIKPEMSELFLKQEFEYIAHKLDLTTSELYKLFNLPIKYFYHYKNKKWFIKLGTNILRTFGFEKRYFR
jgi:N-acetyl sugar amidotransferase